MKQNKEPTRGIKSNPPKLGTVIAEKIEKEILRAGWSVGTVIATEAELADQFHVSRATIREAVGQIERRGIATMRRGNRGGLVVSAPARSAVVRALATYMELANADLEEMLDARLLLETQAVGLAAERVDARGLQLLRAHAQQLSLRTGSLEDDSRMHMAIRETVAEITGNPLLALLIEALDFSSRDVTFTNTDDPRVYEEVIIKTIALKRDLVGAIADCDKVAAQQIVRKDVELQKQGYLSARALRGYARKRPPALPDLKLPHSLAIRISQDIRLHKWLPGQRIGSEVELMKRYSLSRSAFRESIRLLESLSVVKMQRGGAGGLVVGTPDPTNTIDSAARYVDYMNLQSSHMHEVREALELGAVQRAAKAATAEDIEKLRNALHEAAIATDAEDMLHRPIAVHLAICRASHSDVISLLTQLVLKAIGSTYSASNLPTAMTHEVGVSHQRIVGAIIARDEGMAKRYMLQHLIMIQRWTALIGQTILKRAPADASAPRLFQIASN